MKRLLFLACLLVFLPLVAAAQGNEIWLPLIVRDYNPCHGDYPMSDWKVIVPEATTNYCLNPSAEIAGNFAAEGGATVTRVSTYQRYGLYAYRVQTAGDNEGVQLTLSALSNAVHYVTLRVRGTLPAAWDWSLDAATYTAPTLLETLDDNWSLYGLEFPAAQANGSTVLRIHQNGAGSGDFYIDGVQVEQKDDYYTTYADGDRQGCSWNGTEHASTSSRSVVSRAGGRMRDLQTDYHLEISGVIGMGAPPQTVTVDEFALLPGGELNAVKVHPRVFTLTGFLHGTSYANLDSIRQSLINLLLPDSYPKDEFGWQPVRLIYTGAAEKRQISAHYEAGLEGNISAKGPCYFEKVAVRFITTDNPFWEDAEEAECAAVLDSNDSITTRYVTARLRSTGQWDDVKPPSGAGGIPWVFAIVRGPDGKIYIGGRFTNWDGIAAADNIVVYDPQTDTYAALGGGLSDRVQDLAFDAKGILYAVGDFDNAGGDAAADRIAQIDPSAGVPAWSNVGGGPGAGLGTAGIVYSIAIDHNDHIFIGGDFTNWDGIANADKIVKYDGVAWSALSTGTDGIVLDIVVKADNNLFIGGAFPNAGGIAVNYIAEWNGTVFSALSSGMNQSVYKLALASNGDLYAVGLFTTSGGVTTNHVTKWNGTAFTPLGNGVDNNNAFAMDIGPDDMLYIGGTFTSVDGINVADSLAKWTGASWAHLGIDLPGTPWVWTVSVSNVDPVIPQNYDIWVGYDTAGATAIGGKVTVTNNGTAEVFPKIVFERSGGTSAVIESVRNETTGKELLFNYSLLDGETLTVDLDPLQKSIVSNFFGSRPDAILANSDFGEFTLQLGDNDVTCFVNVAGAPTVTAYMTWQNQYR